MKSSYLDRYEMQWLDGLKMTLEHSLGLKQFNKWKIDSTIVALAKLFIIKTTKIAIIFHT